MSLHSETRNKGLKPLNIAAQAWYVPVLLGQFIFAAYIIYTYGFPLLGGDLESLNNGQMRNVFVPDRNIGNLAAISHVFVGIVIHIGGPLQLVPWVRKKFPTFHRWTGRAFMVTVAFGVISGLYLVFTREVGSFALRAGFVCQAILLVWFGYYTLRHALRREFAHHMRWAMRLFLAASAVWFSRVFILVWFVLTGGLGIDTSNGTGWPLDVLAVAQFLPLPLYELYMHVKQKGSPKSKYIMSAFLWLSAALMFVGVTLATLGIWFPVLG